MLKLRVYIDGFNLFYGALKKRPYYRWLNVKALVENICNNFISDYEITAIKFFTARIKPRSTHDDSPKYQQIYFNALKTIPNLEIILGRFDAHPKKAVVSPLRYDSSGNIVKQEVIFTEEKGSDVNLASNFIIDSYEADVDIMVMITNDTDLCTPLRFVSEQKGKMVIVLNPFKQASYSIKELSKVKIYNIDTKTLANSQFPARLYVPGKTIICPAHWK